jgi:hypothetical protein
VTFKYVTVTLTPTGPSPTTVTRSASPQVFLDFVNNDSVAHNVVFAGGHCSIDVPPGAAPGSYECHDGGPTRVGTYYYTVDGEFPGTVHVVGLFRSVSVTARPHTIRFGGGVKLLGQLTLDNEGGPFCPSAYRDVILLLARHRPSQPFRRIAMFPISGRPRSKRAVNNRCTYAWQRKVRPVQSTTYIAKTSGGLYAFKPATSRPVTVEVRS